MRYPLQYRIAIFFGLSLIMSATAYGIVRSMYFTIHGDLLAMALTIDLTLLLPFFYFMILRKTSIPVYTVIPVFILSLWLTGLLLPVHQHEYLDTVKLLLIPLECVVSVWIVYQTHRLIKDQRKSVQCGADFMEALRGHLHRNLGNAQLANILTTEISIFYYALSGWKAAPTGERSSTYFRRSGYFTLIWVFLFLIVLETGALHLLLREWNQTLAWVLSALSIYGIIFLIGDMNGVRRRPIHWDEEYLYLRIGLRWYSKIPRTEVHSIEVVRKEEQTEDHADFVLFGSPNVLIRFEANQSAIGLYGLKKTFRTVSLSVDQPELFRNSMSQSII